MFVRIHDNDGSGEYDLFVVAPDGVTIDQIDNAVRDTREADPDEYGADDLYERLAEIGVFPAEIVIANEVF